jgi:hypothetical protein
LDDPAPRGAKQQSLCNEGLLIALQNGTPSTTCPSFLMLRKAANFMVMQMLISAPDGSPLNAASGSSVRPFCSAEDSAVQDDDFLPEAATRGSLRLAAGRGNG